MIVIMPCKVTSVLFIVYADGVIFYPIRLCDKKRPEGYKTKPALA